MSKKNEKSTCPPEVIIRDAYHRPPYVGQSFKSHPSKTIQAFKAECDINNTVAKAVRSGMPVITSGQARQALFCDVSGVEDYQSSLAALEAAETGFAHLPAKVRDHFGNDPAALLRFIDQGGDLTTIEQTPAAPAAPVPPGVSQSV